MVNLAGIDRQKGELTAALEAYTHSVRIRESLVQRDREDEEIRFRLAESQSSVGRVYEALASRPHTPPEQQRSLCAQARSWLIRSLPPIVAREKQGRLVGDEVPLPADTQAALHRCEQRAALRHVDAEP